MENWPRWIHASVSQYFETALGAVKMTGELEANEPEEKDSISLRITGPDLNELSKDYYELYVYVSLLVISLIDEKDTHRIHVNTGKVLKNLKSIPVYKYGDGPDDDQEFLGCLGVITDDNNPITVNYFGQVHPQYSVEQAIVSAKFRMELETNG